jgi:DNA-binding CsgD family transcriptional regulator
MPAAPDSEREPRVATLYKRGCTQQAIADRLGVNVWTVGADLDRLERFSVVERRSRGSSPAIRKSSSKE